MLKPALDSISQIDYLLVPFKKKNPVNTGKIITAITIKKTARDYWLPGHKKDRHKLDRKTRHWINFLKSENYLLTSIEGWVLSGRETYISFIINNKNLFFYRHDPSEPFYLERQKDYLFAHLVWREREELNEALANRPYQFRKRWEEIKVKVEILSQWNHPTKLVAGYKENGRPRPTWEAVGWNSDSYWEVKNRSLAALAFTHEIVLGKIGTDTPLLDLDPNKKDSEGNYRIKEAWLRKSLSVGGKKWKALIRKYRLPYYWTTATPGNSCLPLNFWMMEFLFGSKVYHSDTQRAVADLLANGDLVALPVGGDKKRQLVITEWGKKLVKKYGVKGILRRNLVSGKKGIEEMLRKVHLSLDRSEIRGQKRGKFQFYTHHLKRTEKSLGERDLGGRISILHPPLLGGLERLEKGGRMAVLIKVLGKEKTNLEDIWKVVCLWGGQRRHFLLNDYQRSGLDELEIGSEREIWLVNGWKHQFFSRVV